ncbi:hypothetical protein TNCV_415901 [Trichonephila clavipes]|nr:hypothetical protein TNCV_415901 [Trichonephila clavipes]
MFSDTGQLRSGLGPPPRSRLIFNTIMIQIIYSSNVIPGYILSKLGISNHMPVGSSGKTALLCHIRRLCLDIPSLLI